MTEYFKVILVGDSSVGKTSLISMYAKSTFSDQPETTIGPQFTTRYVEVPETGQRIKLQIWDTAGQESFKSVTRIFYRGAHCVFLTYDITREETFANLSQWLSEVKQHATEDVRIYMVGNKSEMEEQREVTYERAVEMAKA